MVTCDRLMSYNAYGRHGCLNIHQLVTCDRLMAVMPIASMDSDSLEHAANGH